MKVNELIDRLMDFDEDKEVYIVDVYNDNKLFEVNNVDNVKSEDFFDECEGVGIMSE